MVPEADPGDGAITCWGVDDVGGGIVTAIFNPHFAAG